MSKSDRYLGNRTKDNEDYFANKIPRVCSCGLHLLYNAYGKHLKSGEHNNRGSKSASEVKAPHA